MASSYSNQTNALREDRTLLIILHISQLATYLTGFGGLIIPLIIWLSTKNKVVDMDEQGKQVVNFQLSCLLYILICIPLILFFLVGIVGMIFIGVVAFVLPIINTVQVANGNKPNYPFTIRFIS